MSEARQYRILEVIGTGGFGKVYRAQLLGAEGFSQEVALKVVSPTTPYADDALRRLKDEARILGCISHRAVVRVQGLVLLEPGWAVVMEYVDGVDCQAFVRGRELPIPVALEIAEEVAGALDAAWNARGPGGEPLRALHRDIKLGNIRITADGGVKVLDFGAASSASIGREAESSSLVLGTLQYLAPERLEGQEGPAADVFSLGMVLGEMLSFRMVKGSVLTTRTSTAELVADLEARVRAMGKDPTGLAELVTRMTALEPGDRPSHAEVIERCRALRRALGETNLREWAPKAVADQLDSAPTVVADQLSGTILIEIADKPPPTVPIRRGFPVGWLLGAGGVALVIGVGVVLLVARLLGSAPAEEPVAVREPPAAAPKPAGVGPAPPPPAPVAEAPVAAPVAAPVESNAPPITTNEKAVTTNTVKLTTQPTEKTEKSPEPPKVVEPTIEATVTTTPPAASPPPPAKVAVGLGGDAARVIASAAGNTVTLPASLDAGAWRITAEFPTGEVWSSEFSLSRDGRVDCLAARARCWFR